MALHLTPADHAADPPAAWQVVKAAERCWHLDSSRGGTIDTFTTRKAAEAARTGGHAARLYEQEGRWFAGQTPAGWRPYAEVAAERECRQARDVARAAGQLARFDVYPPEVNGRDGPCLACRREVPAGTGLICLGHDDGGTFAAPLHKRCGELVNAEHKRQTAERKRAG